MGYKGDFSAGSTQDFKYGHPGVRKKIRDIGTQLQARATERIGIGEYLHGIGTDQRNWANLKIRPIERALSQVIRDRLTDTGQQALTASAQQGTMDAYDRSAASATRNAARYGVAIDPSQDRGYQLNRTASAIEAGDLAARTDRENALNEAGLMYGYGSSLPSDAAETYAAGAGSLADQGDYAAGIKIGKRVGEGDAATGAGMAWSGMADGGEVGNSRMGVMGTSGRVIDGEAVELDSGDFIVPEHAVQYYGQEFWDRIIAEAGGDVEPDYAYGGEVRYARGGVVDDDELEPIKWLTREKLTGRRERIEGPQNADEFIGIQPGQTTSIPSG